MNSISFPAATMAAMIEQLQSGIFMREKIAFLAQVAHNIRNSISELAGLQFSEEGSEVINDLDITELLGSMDALAQDETLGGDAGYWLPHNAYAALLQSNLDTYYRVNQCVEQDGGRFGEKLTLSKDPLVSKNLSSGPWDKFKKAFQLNRKDPHWVLVLQAKAIKRRKGPPPFPDNSVNPSTLSTNARVLLVGDWGSGVPDAVTLAQTMWKDYVKPKVGHGEIHVIHLGDVYYAGLKTDYKHRFLKDWPVPFGEKQVKSWCLAGNHDMYSGGHGFFEMLKDPRFAAQNQASYFLLENADWQVFGLDTSFDPHDYKGDVGELYGEQAAWVAQKRGRAPKAKCLMLTHHQPFCAYSIIKENLDRRFRPIRNAHQIDAWFWGHEHLCAVYDDHDNVRFPVLLGHGGFPQMPKPKRKGASPIKYEWLATGSSGDILFGFAVLDFKGPQIDVQLVDQVGKLQHQFVIL